MLQEGNKEEGEEQKHSEGKNDEDNCLDQRQNCLTNVETRMGPLEIHSL